MNVCPSWEIARGSPKYDHAPAPSSRSRAIVGAWLPRPRPVRTPRAGGGSTRRGRGAARAPRPRGCDAGSKYPRNSTCRSSCSSGVSPNARSAASRSSSRGTAQRRATDRAGCAARRAPPPGRSAPRHAELAMHVVALRSRAARPARSRARGTRSPSMSSDGTCRAPTAALKAAPPARKGRSAGTRSAGCAARSPGSRTCSAAPARASAGRASG